MSAPTLTPEAAREWSDGKCPHRGEQWEPEYRFDCPRCLVELVEAQRRAGIQEGLRMAREIAQELATGWREGSAAIDNGTVMVQGMYPAGSHQAARMVAALDGRAAGGERIARAIEERERAEGQR